jgi:thiamine-monophosphate kinase
MDEFNRIATYFAPLTAKAEGAFGLCDDAALLTPPADEKLVITQDTLVESIHFIGTEPAASIAQKALRVNLSDLAAKGAVPLAYFLSLSLPASRNDAWVEDFARGLHADQEQYGITLMGGDSTASAQGVVITITAIGTAPRMIRRSGANEDDTLFVTGTIGDAFLGLQAARGEYPDVAMLSRYRLPQPRTHATALLRRFATAALDVSDGLLQDAQHLCTQSGIALEIILDNLPLSDAASRYACDLSHLLELATAGDDYEILFTAPPEKKNEIQQLAQEAGLQVSAIGRCRKGTGLHLSHAEKAIPLPKKLGYTHAL